MKQSPNSPTLTPLTLAEEEDEFTNEGAPPPGIVGTDLPHRRSTGPTTSRPRPAAGPTSDAPSGHQTIDR